MVAKRDIRVGGWVRFLYDDTGAQDGVVIDTSLLKEHGFLTVLVENEQAVITHDQVVKVGDRIMAKYSGLD